MFLDMRLLGGRGCSTLRLRFGSCIMYFENILQLRTPTVATEDEKRECALFGARHNRS